MRTLPLLLALGLLWAAEGRMQRIPQLEELTRSVLFRSRPLSREEQRPRGRRVKMSKARAAHQRRRLLRLRKARERFLSRRARRAQRLAKRSRTPPPPTRILTLGSPRFPALGRPFANRRCRQRSAGRRGARRRRRRRPPLKPPVASSAPSSRRTTGSRPTHLGRLLARGPSSPSSPSSPSHRQGLPCKK